MAALPVPDALLREAVDAMAQFGTQQAAALSLGISRTTLQSRLMNAQMRGVGTTEAVAQAKQGYSPEHDLTHIIPQPLILGAFTNQYNGQTGALERQWVKGKLESSEIEKAMRISLEALSQSVAGLAPMTPPPEHGLDDLLVVYPMGDPHIGMYAWAAEAGEDFDLGIARELTLSAVDRLVSVAPAARTAIILPLGDVFHMDNQTNTTPGHGNQLDADSRYVKVIGIGVEVFIHAVKRALEKHQKVVVRFVRGNHDPHAIWALAFSISCFFSNEPRVTVDLSPSWFWYYRFGSVLIGSTHGDVVKHEKLPGIMAADRAKDWGDTAHRYWYTGHIHSKQVHEYPGVICESFRTLAAKDAYAAGYGYRAGRDMECIVHHRVYGEIERHRCDIGMIE